MVLDAVGQQDNTLGIQCLDSTLVVAHQHNGTGGSCDSPPDPMSSTRSSRPDRYRPIPEFIAGFSVTTALPRTPA